MLSSSLPAREGALESSKGEANGEPKGAPMCRLSRLGVSELQLVRREDMPDTVREGPSTGTSWYGLGRALAGGSNRESVDSKPPEP